MTADAWIESLPAELAPHAGLLARLLDALERDERYRALELQCSVARGTADALSDLGSAGERRQIPATRVAVGGAAGARQRERGQSPQGPVPNAGDDLQLAVLGCQLEHGLGGEALLDLRQTPTRRSITGSRQGVAQQAEMLSTVRVCCWLTWVAFCLVSCPAPQSPFGRGAPVRSWRARDRSR